MFAFLDRRRKSCCVLGWDCNADANTEKDKERDRDRERERERKWADNSIQKLDFGSLGPDINSVTFSTNKPKR